MVKTLNVFALLIVSFSINGQEKIKSSHNHPYSALYAKREIIRLDKNMNGFIEKSESKQKWKRLSHLDSNADEKLSLLEYSNIEIPKLETKGTKKLNIVYKTTQEEDLYLDIYYPNLPTNNKLPVVFYTHGGGWVVGSKENIVNPLMKVHFLELLMEGFAVVSINYRLVDRERVAMRDCIIDAIDALHYLSKHKSILGLETDQVFVMGDSAGGQIAQMLTLADANLFSGEPFLKSYTYKVKAGISWYGPTDFTKTELFKTSDYTKNPDRFGDRIFKKGMDRFKKEFYYKEVSPVFYLTSQSSPLLIMAAENDTTIPVAHAFHMKNKAEQVQANVEVFIVKNSGHNWRSVSGDLVDLKAIRRKTVDFFLEQLD